MPAPLKMNQLAFHFQILRVKQRKWFGQIEHASQEKEINGNGWLLNQEYSTWGTRPAFQVCSKTFKTRCLRLFCQDPVWEVERFPRPWKLHRPASQGWWWRGWVSQGADSTKLELRLKSTSCFRRCLHPSRLCCGVFSTSLLQFRQQTSLSSRLLG